MKPVYINHHHEVIIETYLDAIHDSVREVTSDISKYRDFQDISNIIIEYHNRYSDEKNEGNFYDFLMIIPINFSTMVSGYFCGLENKENATLVRIHRNLLYNYGQKVIEDLRKLQPIND